MGKQPAILVVSFRPIPVPPVAGYALRILETARYLATRGYAVDLLYVGRRDAGSDAGLRRAGIFRRVFRFWYEPWQFGANALLGVVADLPIQVRAYTFPDVARFLGERQHDYRAILANYVRVGELLRGLTVPVLLDLHDAISLHYARAAAVARGPRRLAYWAEGARLLRYELACVRRFPLSVIVSDVDREYLISHGAPADRLVAVPVAVPRDLLLREPPAAPDEEDCVFVGRMAYAPNRDAALWFAKDILPRVREQVPGARFAVVGADPPREVRSLDGEPGITVTGTVPDPHFWVERAKAVVAPIRYGAGMQNKVLQGLALRRAVVLSSLSAESLGGIAGEHYLVADGPAEFAAATARCLEDQALRARLGAAGRELIERRYSWDAVGNAIAEAIERLAAQPRPA
ncbi:MAG: glycosyltransferase [Candidatus Sericytochromatia bacterium]|nr:glycosyltransferase [Candidatus Tanganyikabacteria bacterium]